MITDQCISVTELAKNASAIIKRSRSTGAQYVFVNNKPQAVILDIATFESLDWDPDMLSPSEIRHYAEARADLEKGINTTTLTELEAKYA
jgi:prevent-host-death family protein